MAGSSSSAFSQEVQGYIRACEHLLSAATTPNSPPFSEDEREIIGYYVAELGKILADSIKK